jgi:hypothetical protein
VAVNHECHGDWIPSMKMYRCLYDGRFVDSQKKPVVCPNCNRGTFPTTVKGRPKLRTVVMQQIKLRKTYQTYQIEFKPTEK